MTSTHSRRAVLSTIAAAALGGCAASRDEEPTETATDDGEASTATRTDTMTPTDENVPGDGAPTDDGTVTPTGQEQVEQLPDRSPLSSSLMAVVAATDTAAAAAEHGIEYRETEHSVRVAVELKPDAQLPEGYRLEVVSSYGGQVIAYVHVRDLVPLAVADAVKKIQRPPESKTNSSTR